MALTVSSSCISVSPVFTLNENRKMRSCIPVRSVVRINGSNFIYSKNADVDSYVDGGKTRAQHVPEVLEPLWDDGYGTRTTKNYVEIVTELIKSDGGPPRWFCPVACGVPLNDSPLLLYLPGMDGTGAGLVLHEKALGKLFHVQCLHIPVSDRTSLEGLIKIVEEIMMIEHASSPNRPIYLLGESFGGSLALSVAARNPTIDLVLILANPVITAFMFSGDFIKTMMVVTNGKTYSSSLWKLSNNLDDDLSVVSVMAKALPKDTFKWRLKLVESAANFANSRLHAITAQVLVVASGKDNLLPSKNEARRLSRLLRRCNVRVFEDSGHNILLESGFNLLFVIKTTQMYRHSSKHDIFKDFLPTSMTEFLNTPMDSWLYRLCIGAAMFSTMENGKIVRGLAGVPNEGPVLVVGNHTFLGFDSFSVVAEFLREKKITIHGLAHPEIYQIRAEDEFIMIPYTDAVKTFGAIPVSARNLFRLLSSKSFALLYPGGARESLHRKGESCKLFWPEKQEFVRMAVKLGATIIPLGAVGEDDLLELLIDYNDMKHIPYFDQMVKDYNRGRKNVRAEMEGEIAKQPLHIPISMPKIPGRLYFMFGKPIRTKGKEHMFDDKYYVQDLYLQIKCDVEKSMAYLLRKREDDPYRSIVERIVWLTNHGSLDHIPSFDP
ncbi:phytyl ester synthase 1, chloroplastic-like [Rutidosis leptorrhynchoides]|uniref:phytyl ester synthase 1, chloroplastic-like n=1 Tax=Rutidosis leptorrhynchoides TaxID=125765 RepID=UPI003A98F57F